MFKVNNKDTKTTPMASLWCLYFNFEHISHLCSRVSIVNFVIVIAGWDIMSYPKDGVSYQGECVV